MRLFFAVLLSEEVREAVARVQQTLRGTAGTRGIRWVEPEQFHYTLKFLGETPERQVQSLVETAAQVAEQSAPISLTLAGLGAFPQARRPQVLWVGATEGVPALTRLAERLDRALAAQGFAPETRRFNPHLTLARIKSPEGEKAAAGALAAGAAAPLAEAFGVLSVNSFALMQSELLPTGPLYTVVETFVLPLASAS